MYVGAVEEIMWAVFVSLNAIVLIVLALQPHLVVICIETINMYIWHMFVLCLFVVTAWGSVGMFVVL